MIITVAESRGPMSSSGSQKIALVALFTSLAFVLNIAISVPAPYAPFLFYEVWEVPILLAVILLGLRYGATVAVLNTLVVQVYRQGALPTGPLYNLIAQLAMIAGVLVAQRTSGGRAWSEALKVGLATATGATVRTLVMTVVNGLVLTQPYPLGFSYPASLVPWTLVLIGVFNFTLTLYTVPVSYSMAKAVRMRYGRMFAESVSPRMKRLPTREGANGK